MVSAVAVLFTLAGSMLGADQLSSTPADLAWVGLYNDELLEALENENRLDALCPPSITTVEAREQCRDEMLKPRAYVVSLRTAPNTSAVSAGSLLLLADPGRGMRFYYVRPEGGQAREFTTDLYLADWGYGPYLPPDRFSIAVATGSCSLRIRSRWVRGSTRPISASRRTSNRPAALSVVPAATS